MTSHRAFLEAVFEAAVAAAHPAALVSDAVAALCDRHPDARWISIIALGKAAPAMAHAAVERLAARGISRIAGIVIGAEDGPAPHARISRHAGDHPLPGERSHRAAMMLDDAARDARATADVVFVLLSGGTTSLVAAPVDGVSTEALTALYDALLRSGWDIAAMNAVRKRFLRWGAGRLAIALAPAPVQLAMLSDVIGDDPATIGSGPCTPDALTAAEILDRLTRLRTLDDATRESLTGHLQRVIRGELAETPKREHGAFTCVSLPLIHGNTTALAAAADHARAAGWNVIISPAPLHGEARERGAEIARALLDARQRAPLCVIHGGETTVSMSSRSDGTGGRCQELALAAAAVLHDVGDAAAPIALLAAGTDGRDGPTDAAGAIVDRDSWRHALARGAAPADALATHDTHRALAAAGALLPARATGTNVMDIVVGLVSAR